MLRFVGWRNFSRAKTPAPLQKTVFRSFSARATAKGEHTGYRGPSWFEEKAKTKEHDSMRKKHSTKPMDYLDKTIQEGLLLTEPEYIKYFDKLKIASESPKTLFEDQRRYLKNIEFLGFRPTANFFASLIDHHNFFKSPNSLFILHWYSEAKKRTYLSHAFYQRLFPALEKAACIKEIQECYYEMLERGITPSSHLLASIMEFYCNGPHVHTAAAIYEDAVKRNIPFDNRVPNALLRGYVLYYPIEKLLEKLKQLKQDGLKPDSYTYSLMMQAHKLRGDTTGLLSYFNEYFDLDINDGYAQPYITLASTIITEKRYNDFWDLYEILKYKNLFGDGTFVLGVHCATEMNDQERLFQVLKDHSSKYTLDNLSVLAVAYAHFGMWLHLQKTIDNMITEYKHMKHGTFTVMVPKLVQHNRADLIEEYYNIAVNSPTLAGSKPTAAIVIARVEGLLRCGELKSGVHAARKMLLDSSMTVIAMQTIIDALIETFPNLEQRDALIELRQSVEHIVDDATLQNYSREMFSLNLLEIEKSIK